MAIDKQRLLVEAFLDLGLQGAEMFLDRSRRGETIAEYLGDPRQFLLFQCLVEKASVGQTE